MLTVVRCRMHSAVAVNSADTLKGEATMSDCLFCKMVVGEIEPDIVYEDDDVLAFRDLHPAAPTHVLVIPRKHIPTINDIADDDDSLIGRLFLAAAEVAKREGIVDSGYRTVMNCGGDAQQSVFHLHLHVIGGRKMNWPPG